MATDKETIEETVARLVAEAPEFTEDQINRLRLILHSGIKTQ